MLVYNTSIMSLLQSKHVDLLWNYLSRFLLGKTVSAFSCYVIQS